MQFSFQKTGNKKNATEKVALYTFYFLISLCSFLEQRFNLVKLAAELFVGLKQIVHCLAGMQHCRVVTVTDTETDFGS